MEPPQDFKSLQEDIQKSLISTVKTVNRLASEDLPFQRTADPDVAEQLDGQSARVLDLAARLLRSAASACRVKPPKLQDAEDIDMRWQSVVDVVDSVLEKADMALDEYTGLIKRKEPPVAEATPPKRSKSSTKAVRNANVAKPQARFERETDNFPTGSWKPILTDKPHATVPLDQSLAIFTGENGEPQYKHPYETEITNMEYPDRLFQVAEPIPPQPTDTTSATWVDTYDGVLDMLKELEKASEIAVDLEHHDFRTYTGLVCLMQISTREKDWIVDTLQPWRHKLEVLNLVFADPSIVKVFHGAYMDMVWLQRDLGLYVNGLFDTYFACDILSYPGKSLAFLLSKFVNFDADKQYQLADWRVRPIPPEMLYYARSDTHYLLYIYDRLRNELVSASDRSDPDKDYIGGVLQRSKDLALSRHEHLGCDEETGQGARGWQSYLLKRAHLSFDGEQFAMFRALWSWRDATARKEDENPAFVLSTHAITDIVRVNPPDVKALHSMLSHSAPLARAALNEIWDRLREAKARGGPSVLRFFSSLVSEPARKPALTARPASTTSIPEPEAEMAIRNLSRSQLFGDMALSTLWEATGRPTGKEDECMPFPWQRFIQGLSGEGESSYGAAGGESAEAGQVTTTTAESAAGNAEAVENDDEEFTLKKGKKPKSDPVECEAADGNEDQGAGGAATAEGDATKPKDRREKYRNVKERIQMAHAKQREDRIARRAKKQEQRDKEQREQRSKDGEAPFDYSKAASVMHAQADKEAGGAARGTRKSFDPYSKTADDGLKGARKAPPVRGERSATFRK